MATNLPKDQIDSDALVTYFAVFNSWYKENKGIFFGAIAAVILLVAGTIWFFSTSAQKEVEARNLLTFAENQFLMGQFETALYGDDESMQPGLIEISSRFSRTEAGNLAKYYAAVSEVNLNNYESALSFISDYRTPSGILGVAPLSLEGKILVQLGRYSEAVRVFERAANWDTNDSTTPFNLLEAAEAAYLAGDHNRARTIVKRIKDEFPDSQQFTQAQRLNGMLSLAN